MSPFVTVVVCTHNRAALLAGALRALELQRAAEDDFEILVIDNGSKDETPRVAGGFSRVRYVLEPRIGLSHARNRGITEARGEYVAFTDDDCEPPEEWLEVAAEVIARHRPEVFGGPYRAFYASPKPAWYKDEYGSRDFGTAARLLGPGETLAGNNMFFHRSVLAAAGGFDPGLGMAGRRIAYAEETALQERIRSLDPDARIYYDPRLYVLHLVRREQMTLRWYLAASFGKGRSAHRARLAGPLAGSRPVLLGRLAYTAVAAAADGVRSVLRRDRERCPQPQNHLWESTSRYFRSLGVLWSAVREPQGPMRGGGR